MLICYRFKRREGEKTPGWRHACPVLVCWSDRCSLWAAPHKLLAHDDDSCTETLCVGGKVVQAIFSRLLGA